MQFTPEAERILSDLARRYGISPEAAQAVFRSLAAHDGRTAQFSHPDLGGMSQWLRGGMTVVGDMFNGPLKQQVDAFCSDLADALQRIGAGAAGPSASPPPAQPGSGATPPPASPASGPISGDPILLIERLAELRQKGILTEEEFTAKKADLLGRL